MECSGKRSAKEYVNEEKGANVWAPGQHPDGTLSDGKTTTYDALAEAIVLRRSARELRV